MVDEWEAAAMAAAPMPAPGRNGAAVGAPEAVSEAEPGIGNTPRGRIAPPETEAGSVAPGEPGARQAPAPACPRAACATDGVRERRLKAGSRQARICEPLWKVRRLPPLIKSCPSFTWSSLARLQQPWLRRACPARAPLWPIHVLAVNGCLARLCGLRRC